MSDCRDSDRNRGGASLWFSNGKCEVEEGFGWWMKGLTDNSIEHSDTASGNITSRQFKRTLQSAVLS